MPKQRTDTQTMLTVARTWDDVPIERREVVWVALVRAEDALVVDVRANLQGDPAPDAPPGRLDKLWEHEVVEVFICGEDGHAYTELEMGPHGHYLLLRFAGERNEIGREYEIEYSAEVTGERWRGKARIPYELLPKQPLRANAYAIHGKGDRRRYLAAYPGQTEAPDFHKLENFRTLIL